MYNLDKDLDAKIKRLDILNKELENNEARCNSISDLLMSKEDAIGKTQQKLGECYQSIQDLKYALNKLDGELNYFENLNEQHKSAQSQMFKGNEFEYKSGKENSLKC
jgi:chromosome segregation ATPase